MALALRACVAGIGALAPVLVMAPAHADDYFQAQTTATAIHVTVTQKPASSIITASLFDDAVAYAAGDFDNGGSSEALAASAFPGRLVVQGPQLLCSQVFTCPVQPPAYPLLADASYPRRPRDTARGGGRPMGSGPFIVTPVSAVAEARAGGNSARTSAGGVSLLAGSPGAVTIGSSRATSTVGTTGSAVHVRLMSVVTDVSIGSALHIDTIRAVDDIRVRPGHRPVDHPSIAVAGVTFAGQAASIDDRGVHVVGNDGPSVSRRLAQHGIAVRTVGVRRHDTSTGARSDATALGVDVEIPIDGVPYIPNPLPPFPPPFDQVPQLPGVNANGVYVAHVTLGAVGAAVGAGRQPTFDLGGVGPVGQQPGTGGHVRTGGQAPPGGGDLLTGLSNTPAQAPPTVAPPAGSLLRRFADALSRRQVELLYAALALGTMTLFLGWRGAVVLRRRPAGSGTLRGGRR
jgi:hypothetical protein